MSHLEVLLLPLLLLLLSLLDSTGAMVKLASALQSTPTSWSTKPPLPYCDWSGVNCDSSNRVTAINLPNSKLTGTLPAEPAVKLNKEGNPLLGTDVSPGDGGSQGSSNGSAAGGTAAAGPNGAKNSLSDDVIIIGLVVFIAILMFLYNYCVNKRPGKLGMVENNGDVEAGNAVNSSEVLQQETNDFSEGNFLGRGGVGSPSQSGHVDPQRPAQALEEQLKLEEAQSATGEQLKERQEAGVKAARRGTRIKSAPASLKDFVLS